MNESRVMCYAVTALHRVYGEIKRRAASTVIRANLRTPGRYVINTCPIEKWKWTYGTEKRVTYIIVAITLKVARDKSSFYRLKTKR